jgi:hypothetical protein
MVSKRTTKTSTKLGQIVTGLILDEATRSTNMHGVFLTCWLIVYNQTAFHVTESVRRRGGRYTLASA